MIAGGPDVFVEVRHIVLRGSNFDIGRQIAAVAMNDGIEIVKTPDVLLNRAKRKYMARNYPILYERMKGVASAYGLSIEDDSYDFTRLSQVTKGSPGCSVAFYPGKYSQNNHSILNRNFDFHTGTIQGKYPRKGEIAVMARPILFEIHPDDGYSSLSPCAFDYLGGVSEGINSEGLAVAMLGEEESLRMLGRDPGDEVGLHELMSMRYLLDNCRNVEEAKEALLALKHFYSFIPCHYIVADRSGKSFVFEFSPNRNRSYIIDGKGPQCVTNHLVSRHKTVEKTPDEDWGGTFNRYKVLQEAITASKEYSLSEMADINRRVAVPPTSLGRGEFAPQRTLWFAQYDLDALTLNVRFYLGEKPDPQNAGTVVFVYSEPLVVKLKDATESEGNR